MALKPDQLGQLFAKVGQFLLVDDARDIGKFDRLHHWQYGLVMALTGELMKVGNMISSFATKLTPPPSTVVPPNNGQPLKQLEKLTKKKTDYLKGRLP